ncbi:MAG: hypothetical protein NUV77_14150, partial [Thermoguttaceae bacterium]|nr:hypothetical protein [Thermoguttaceae bacterium]
RQSELDAREAHLNDLETRLEREARDLRARHAELETWLRSQQDQIQSRQEEIEARLAELEARDEAMRSREERLDRRWAELEARDATPRAEPEPVPSVPVSDPADSSLPSDPTGQAPSSAPQTLLTEQPVSCAAPPERTAPVTTDAIFRRLGIRLPVDEDPMPVSAPALALASAPAARPDSPQPTQTPPAEPSEDESLDSYMERLLARVREASGRATSGESSDSPPPPPQQATQTTQTIRSDGSRDANLEGSATSREAPKLKRAGRFVLFPKTIAPEKGSHLAAMRELANLSARNALDQHGRIQIRRAIRGKLAVTLGSAAVGSLLVAVWTWRGAGEVAYYAGLVSYLIAVLWGLQYAVLTGRLIVSRSGHLAWRSRPPAPRSLEKHSGKKDADIAPAQAATSPRSNESTSPR